MKKIFTLFLFCFLFYEGSNAQIGSYASVYAGCPPLTVQFQDTSLGNPTCCYWDFDINNGLSNICNPSVTYITPGTYHVLHVVCYGNARDSQYITIQVFEPPQVNFEAPDRFGCIQPCHTVNFGNYTIPGQSTVELYVWDFGDGSLAYEGYNASHCYDSISAFNVTLVAIDSNGCEASLVKPNYVVIGISPTSNITITPTKSCFQPRIVHFTGVGSSENGPVSYEWYFDTNGYTSTLQNPTFVYYDGIYNPYLVVSDSLGCTDTVYGHVVVETDTINPYFFVSNNYSSCPPLPVQFYNTSNYRENLKYLWYFGDGDTSTYTDPLHLYFLPGNYSVTLIAIDTTGCSNSTTNSNLITIGGPTEQIQLTPDSGCTPLTVSITGTVSFAVSIVADLGDGTTIQDTINLTHTYTNPGFYFPTYALTDSLGCEVVYPIDTVIVNGICDTLSELSSLTNSPVSHLFPNPANDILNINLEQAQISSDDVVFEIYNSLGQVVVVQKISKQLSEQKIDVSELANGLYAVVIKKNESVIGVAKFVKE